MTEADGDGFLSRWSRRKTAAREDERTQATEPPSPDAEFVPSADVEAAADTLEEIKLPDLETLDGNSDYRPFMRSGVPPELRRDALRRLWRANPIINSVDGIDDHYVTHDFTDGATVVSGLRTLYRVGKGLTELAESLDRHVSRDQDPTVAAVADANDGREMLVGQSDPLELPQPKSDLARNS